MFQGTPGRLVMLIVVAVAAVLTAGRACGIGFILGESKDQLALKYDVTVQEHASGRVTLVFTLADEGRLKPVDEVQLAIPAPEKNQDGGSWMDLVVSIDMTSTDGGKRVGRVHLLKELAERAEIRLNTHTLDSKPDPFTRLHHVIPIAGYLKNAPSAVSLPAAAPTPADERPATERKQD